jgi:uncharacterized C2H2 Zn-finger protein
MCTKNIKDRGLCSVRPDINFLQCPKCNSLCSVPQAYEKVVAAQKANEWDMNGHTQKAKELLDQANRELKQAAEAANRNEK